MQFWSTVRCLPFEHFFSRKALSFEIESKGRQVYSVINKWAVEMSFCLLMLYKDDGLLPRLSNAINVSGIHSQVQITLERNYYTEISSGPIFLECN